MSRQMTGAEMIVTALEDQGRRHDLRLSRRRRVADLRRAVPAPERQACARPPRAGRGPCRRGLRAVVGQGRRDAGDLGPRRHQCRDGADRRRCSTRSRWSASPARFRRISSARTRSRNATQPASRATAPSTITSSAASRTCRASCTRPSMSPRTAGRARSSSTFRRMCNSPTGTYVGAVRTCSHIGPTSRSVKGETRQASASSSVALMKTAAKSPVFYTGGGVINAGPEGLGMLLRELVGLTNFPLTSTLDGPRRLSGLGQKLARHAWHARHLRGQPRHA